MQYIVTDDEMQKTRDDSRDSGFDDATSLLGDILHGKRDFSLIGCTRYPRPTHIMDDENKHSPWRKLIDRLDGNVS